MPWHLGKHQHDLVFHHGRNTHLRPRKQPVDFILRRGQQIGDVGRGVFVQPGIAEFMRDHAVPAAQIVTPNHFELDYLTGRTTTAIADVLSAIESLRKRGPRVVMVTSLVAEETPGITHRAFTPDKIELPLHRRVDKSFLEYASYVIRDRAIPNLEDGLKPVQRRILWTLHRSDDGRFVKVANIVGDCMKYHPHGDSATYEALVRMAQDFSMRYPRRFTFTNSAFTPA